MNVFSEDAQDESFTPSKTVTSSQLGVHAKLIPTLDRHLSAPYKKPVPAHTQTAFDVFMDTWVDRGRPALVLDSACGTGQSTHYLAGKYHDHFVVGLDQSAKRLSHADNQYLPDNGLLLRCDCTDFWRLAQLEGLVFVKHYLLYPNPYPKPAHLQRRWHGHPAFNALLAISQSLELRTNWPIYAEEFACALEHRRWDVQFSEYKEPAAITAFEKKYQQSQHHLWQVLAIPY